MSQMTCAVNKVEEGVNMGELLKFIDSGGGSSGG